MFFKTFAEKQRESKGRAYDYDLGKANSEILRLRKLLAARPKCPGCDGHECDERCAYPGALSSTERKSQ